MVNFILALFKQSGGSQPSNTVTSNVSCNENVTTFIMILFAVVSIFLIFYVLTLKEKIGELKEEKEKLKTEIKSLKTNSKEDK